MNNKLQPCLWFDGQAKNAATFYCSIFSNAKIVVDTPMVVKFELEGKMIMGLNGGPMFRINPSISFFVTCTSTEEIEQTWEKLMDGGKAMMPLDKYPWSEKYGWLVDKFGMTWQLILGELPDTGQKIICSFLFTGDKYGQARQAMEHYTAIFPGSKINQQELYQAGEAQPEGSLKFGQFSLIDEQFAAMDGFGAHEFVFNEGVSILVECENQDEIDHYWNSLTAGGKESMCGWLVDKFGVSWQIVPRIIGNLMSNPDKAGKVMQELMKMKKIEINTLLHA